jgi:hypothetical protein
MSNIAHITLTLLPSPLRGATRSRLASRSDLLGSFGEQTGSENPSFAGLSRWHRGTRGVTGESAASFPPAAAPYGCSKAGSGSQGKRLYLAPHTRCALASPAIPSPAAAQAANADRQCANSVKGGGVQPAMSPWEAFGPFNQNRQPDAKRRTCWKRRGCDFGLINRVSVAPPTLNPKGRCYD